MVHVDPAARDTTRRTLRGAEQTIGARGSGDAGRRDRAQKSPTIDRVIARHARHRLDRSASSRITLSNR